jgi:2-polyprenyl-3-methyl-5-hydroxy-6-metoxy-1,4-benzoquinol methylase
MGKWYEDLFKDYAQQYDKEEFTKGTLGEVDFIENEIGFDKSFKILDIGCGTGRHTIELAKRGYLAKGIDLSIDQLDKAKQKASAAGILVEFEQKDARDFSYPNQFNLAIMICEGAFSLMETDEMNYLILQNAFNSITSGGKLVFTTLNGLFPLFHSVKDFINNGIVEGESKENTFDLMTFRDYSTFDVVDDKGNRKVLECNERYYVPSEINWLLKSIGFTDIAIHGCKLGAFSRNDKLTTEDYEMLVIAKKS